MDKPTSKALEASILHWKGNAAAESLDDVNIKSSACALCQMFPLECDGCPIMEKTGMEGCGRSPYHKAWRYEYSGDLPNFKKIALEMVTFLESLRDD